MAKELGYFAERGLDVELDQAGVLAGDAGQPAQRRRSTARTALFSMPISVATGIGGTAGTDLKIAMMLNNNGQAITLKKEFAARRLRRPGRSQGVARAGSRRRWR